jgi:hypothetical protein
MNSNEDELYNDDENGDTDEGMQPSIIPGSHSEALMQGDDAENNIDDDEDDDLDQFIQNDDCEDGDLIDENTIR